jgi:hypothetical protein
MTLKSLILTSGLKPRVVVPWKLAVRHLLSGGFTTLIAYPTLTSISLSEVPSLQEYLRGIIGATVPRIDLRVPSMLVEGLNPQVNQRLILEPTIKCHYCHQFFPSSFLSQDPEEDLSHQGCLPWVVSCPSCRGAQTSTFGGSLIQTARGLADAEAIPEEWLPYLSGQSLI